MKVEPGDLPAERAYRLLTGIVVPRPVAWISSLSAGGAVNLAPFSAFMWVSPKPPLLAVSIGHKRGVYKDTVRNILAREEYVIHIADSPLLDALHQSSVEHPPEVSEVDELGLATLPCDRIGVPRVAAAPVAMECRLRHVIEFGDTRSRLVIGEVLLFHLRDGLVNDGKIETRALDPIARLAGPNYATIGEVITLPSVFQTPKS